MAVGYVSCESDEPFGPSFLHGSRLGSLAMGSCNTKPGSAEHWRACLDSIALARCRQFSDTKAATV